MLWDTEGSITGSHTRDSKMVCDVALIKPQHYKVRIQGNVVEQSKERSSALPYILVS